MQLDSLRKDAQSNVRQMRAARAVGLGCLAALALLLAQRTAPLALSAGVEAYKPFLAAILSGFVAMGVLGCLACHAQTYGQGGPSASRAWRPMAMQVLAGCALAVGGVACRLSLPDTQFALGSGSMDVAGFACGAGLSLLALPWMRIFARLGDFGSILRETAWALAVSCVLYAGCCCVCVASDALATVFACCLALLAASVACCMRAARAPLERGWQADAGAASNDGTEGKARPDDSPMLRLWVTLRSVWQPLAGAAAGAFIFGLSWDGTGASMLNNGMVLMIVEETLGGLLAAVLALAALARMGGARTYQSLCRVGLPIMAAIFLATPYLPQDLFGVAWQEGVAVVRECCMSLIGIFAWAALANIARTADISTGLLSSLGCISVGLPAFAGLSLLHAFGPPAAPLGAALIVFYLMALTLSFALESREQRSVRAVEREVFDRYLHERALALASEHGLSRREEEVLLYLGRGHSYVFIAEQLHVSESTARTHVRNIFKKLDVGSREELLGLIDAK